MKRFLTFIRFSHTIFALPFALGAMFVAADGWPEPRLLLLVIVCMVFARTAAMVFNRLADWELDKRNPRSMHRHTLVSRSTAVAALVVSSLGFIATTWWINLVCFLLSPVALGIIFFYSLTKRFSAYTHLFLGLALAVAPVGAWLAVTGQIHLPALVLAAGVLFWVAGFDLIYATQDYEFDRAEGLHSLVVRIGVARSLVLSQWLHGVMFLLLIGFGITAELGWIYYGSLVPIFGALLYEHRAASRPTIEQINVAFFNSNAFVGLVFVAGTLLDRL